MTGNRRIFKFIVLFIAILFIVDGFKITVQAKKTGFCVSTTLDKATGVIRVKYKGTTIASTTYKPTIVYAKVDLTYVRRGPGNLCRKVKKIKFDMGDRLIRIGKLKHNWSIIMVKGKRYFVKSKCLSTVRPAKKLSVKKYTARQFKRIGVIYWNGWRWTWYSQRVLSGGGLHIPGRHVDTNSFVCDKNGYICLASGRLKRGTIVKTPFGKKGKVYDSGCASGTLDVYTDF